MTETVLPGASSVDFRHPPLPKTTARPYPPGARVPCDRVGSANLLFREVHQHFDAKKCKKCQSFKDCGHVEGKLPPGS